MPAALRGENIELARPTLATLVGLTRAASGLRLRERTAHAAQSGNYLSHFKGRGMEFDETRLYTPGDDVRNLDWRVTARTGKPHTKVFREERERPVFLSVDARPPMFFATRGAFKYVQAAHLAALLAWSAQRHGDRIGGQVFTEAGGVELKPEHGRRAVLHLLQKLADAAPVGVGRADTGLDQALARLAQHARPGSLVFVFSDFRGLGPVGEFSLLRLRRHCDMALVFLSDPLESQLPDSGRYRFAHGGRETSLDASKAAAAAHAQRYAQRRDAIEQLARQQRMRFIPCLTTDDPLTVLRDSLHKRPPAT
ncbi:MAG: DUF58 domain-containing protein [Candidatus Methylumidiphilus sp.]